MDNFLFSIEDTYDGCYSDFIQILLQKNWSKNTSDRWKRKIPSSLIWTINERDINFDTLQPWQIVNHFNGINELTTKMGFCTLLQESQWIGVNSKVIAPRCYNIGDPIHRENFLYD